MTSRQLLMTKADTLTETEVAEVLEYIGIMESLREQYTQAGLSDEAKLFAWARTVVRQDRGGQRRAPGVKGMGSLRI